MKRLTFLLVSLLAVGLAAFLGLIARPAAPVQAQGPGYTCTGQGYAYQCTYSDDAREAIRQQRREEIRQAAENLVDPNTWWDVQTQGGGTWQEQQGCGILGCRNPNSGQSYTCGDTYNTYTFKPTGAQHTTRSTSCKKN